MCGIAGIVDYGQKRPVDADLLRQMNSSMVHRGPDDAGMHIDRYAGIAMRRLAVIDLTTGHQPISNEDGSVWVVTNGEIYNFDELRSRLIERGHEFRTKSDIEVVVHLYEEYGVEAVDHLRGMFALALWDQRNERLLLARDRAGMKPLNYAISDGRIAWASELRALRLVPGVSTDIDYRALDCYLSLQYVPSPLTIYEGCRKLPAGHRLVVDRDGPRVEKYWDLPTGDPLDIAYEEAREELVRLIEEAVRLRLISDVPLGALLSGGVDSSVVVAVMSRLSDRPVKTFSIGFEEQDFSELEHARVVADRWGTDHTEFMVRPEMADALPEIAWHHSEPFADPSALPSYYLSRETRRGVTVALNGDGGDETFAGYLRYAALKASRRLDLVPSPIRRAVGGVAGMLPHGDTRPRWRRARRFATSVVAMDTIGRHQNLLSAFQDGDKGSLLTQGTRRRLDEQRRASGNGWGGDVRSFLDGYYDQVGEADYVNQVLYVDFKTYLADNLMAKMDIASMAHSLEARSPLLDQELIGFVARLPSEWKLSGLRESKHLLKDAMASDLPPSISARPKMGFGIPLPAWFRGELREFWRANVLSDAALGRGYFEPAVLRTMFDDHVSGRRDHGLRMWTLLMLELWHQAYA